MNCTKPAEELRAGGIYSIASGDGRFGVVKVLVVDPNAVHVRSYSGKWSTRPASVNTAELRLGTIHEPDPGMGHLPLSRRVFAAWAPKLVATADVTDEELEGYREWKQAGGSVWDE
jgi:hypothetical protein